MDSGQLMERFRHLSRDIQIGLQSSNKHLNSMKAEYGCSDQFKKLETSLDEIKRAWDSYYGWVLLSTLDDIDEAHSNCAAGYVDLRSKIIRTKSLKQNYLNLKGLKVDLNGIPSCLQIQTYIPYFEQALDLTLENAIKYSVSGGTIEFLATLENSRIKLRVHSIGPTVLKHESPRLGEKGFRCENARKMLVQGQGYGLYNLKRIAELINSKVDFIAENKIICHSNGIAQSNFTVVFNFPETL